MFGRGVISFSKPRICAGQLPRAQFASWVVMECPLMATQSGIWISETCLFVGGSRGIYDRSLEGVANDNRLIATPRKTCRQNVSLKSAARLSNWAATQSKSG